MVNMAHFTIVLICLFPLVLSQCTLDRARASFKRSVYDFTSDLTPRIAYETENHFVFSPLSLWSLLSAISEGAEGQTLSEIQKVLRHPHKCFVKKFYELVQEVVTQSDGVTVNRAGAVVVDQTMILNETFAEKVGRYGIADVMSISFDRFDYGANAINEYVRGRTQDEIESIVTAEDLRNKHLLMLDIINFRGKWSVPFLDDTDLSSFYDESGKQIGDVNLMFMQSHFKTANVPQIKSRVLELPYGVDKRFSMLLMLPYKINRVSEVIESLKNVNIRSFLTLLDRSGTGLVSLQLPRFKVTSEVDNLVELLGDMGVRDMFEQTAQFPYISQYSLYVSSVMQKATVEVNEEGTSASAVSEAEFQARSMPEDFTFNKPFVFMIVDRITELVIFTGAYSKPDASY